MKALLHLVTAATLALTATAALIAERDQPKKDHVEKPLDPLVPGTDGAKVTTVKYG
jgi:hypothetical protein